MQCPKCRNNNREGLRFCSECGHALSVACPYCGFKIEPGEKFCGGCGHKLSKPEDELSESATSSIGERRHATVLFSDLSGFTAMTEKLDPEEVQAVMRRLKDGAAEIVESHGGIVSQFVGDEVLALFGIPVAHEDDPVRAVRAAQQIHALARKLSPNVEDKIRHELRMHTGIDTGLVVTSTADTRDGTVGVTGDTVNTAARLKASAGDDAILISPETQRLAGSYFETRAQETLNLKGKSEPVTPYWVTGTRDVATRFEAAAARGLTPFAGRKDELGALQRALEAAVAGSGQFVSVIGEPGVGKSRLAYEFRQSIDRNNIVILEGRCQSYGAETPYLPFLDALRRSLSIHELEDATTLHDTAVTNILAVDRALERYLPHLLHLLSVPSEIYRLQHNLQGDALRRELEDALVSALIQNARRQPVVVLLEDWHWADEASDAALQRVINLMGRHSLLLLVLYRPEYKPAWGEFGYYTSIVLKALSVANTEAMLRSVMGVRSLPAGLGEHIHARTGGNALFNEELVWSLVEEQIVTVDNEVAQLSKSLDGLNLPDSVHAVIRARADRLDASAREVLRLASVIGREFKRAVLERLYPSQLKLEQALDVLRRHDLVHQVSVLPKAEYIFKHVLTQEVVYETLLISQRKQLHGQVGAAIEALYADRLEEHFESLANQYAKSGEVTKAIEFLEKAGDKAANYSSFYEARTHYEQAAGLHESLDESPPTARSQIDVTLKWARVSPANPSPNSVQALEKAFLSSKALGDIRLIAETGVWCAHHHCIMSDFPRGLELAEHVISIEPKLSAKAPVTQAYITATNILMWNAELQKAAKYAAKGRELLNDSLEPFWDWQVLDFSGLIAGFTGQFGKAFKWMGRARDVAETNDLRVIAAWVEQHTALIFQEQGRWSEVVKVTNLAIKISEENGDPFCLSLARSCHAYSRLMTEWSEKGIVDLQGGINALQETGVPIVVSWFYALLADALCLGGRATESIEWGKRALELRETGDRFGEPHALRALAMSEACREKPDWESVGSGFLESIDTANERGQHPQASVSRFRFAECMHKKGDRNAARDQLDFAEQLFRNMGMDWWTREAEALRGRIDSGAAFVWFSPYSDGRPAAR